MPLEKWHIQINYGIKSGNNEAFYITTGQRHAMVAEDPRCAELIVPLLRGRNVERYATTWHAAEDEKWMIATFPSLNLQFDRLPVPIQRHLTLHREALEPKPAGWKGSNWPGRKGGTYEWFELQDAIAYRAEFNKPKVIYPNMTKYLPFYVDTAEHFFVNDKAFIITTEDEALPYLAAVLNSCLFRCCFMDNFPNLGEDRREIRKIFMEKVQIKRPTASQAALFEKLVALTQAAKRKARDANTTEAVAADFLVGVLDACVMEVYFAEHMIEKGLEIAELVRALLPNTLAALSADDLCLAAVSFYKAADNPKHPIRNILLRIPADSPDLLAVIQREGAV